MPNYCNNSLSIHASHDTLERIKSFVEGGDTEEPNAFDFKKIIPMPSSLFMGPVGPEEEEKYGKNNWYDWSCENWGTKWNSVGARVEEREDTIEYYFETAWSPCEPVIFALAKMFPDANIHYSYYEAGWCFCGQREFENGEIVYSMDGEYYEKWKDDDEDENPDDYRIGSSLSVKNEKNIEDACVYDFEYHEGFLDYAVEITGFVIDRRSVKTAFMW
jgi:hypothetical protein